MTQVGKEGSHEAGWSLPRASLQRAHSEGPGTGEQKVHMRAQSRGVEGSLQGSTGCSEGCKTLVSRLSWKPKFRGIPCEFTDHSETSLVFSIKVSC